MKENDLKTPSASPTNVGSFGGGRDVFKTTNSAGNSSFSDRANGLNRGQLKQIGDQHSLSSVPGGASKPAPGDLGSARLPVRAQSELSGATRPVGEGRNFGNHVIPAGGYDGPDNLRDVGVAIRRGVEDVADYTTRPLRAGAGAYYGGLRDLATGIITDKTKAEAANDSLSALPVADANGSELKTLGVQPGQTTVDGVGYKNVNGQDIYETTNAEGHRSYSDHGALSGDQKNAAAKIDKDAAVPTLTNVVDSTFFKGPKGLDRRQEAALDPRVRAAREAAMARGDFKAASRSLMSESELAEVKFKERMEKGRQAAYDRDPVAAYAIDQDSLVAAGRRAAGEKQSNYRRQRDRVEDGYRHDDSIVKRNLAISKIISEMEMANQFEEGATLRQKWAIAEELYNGNSSAVGDGGAEGRDPEAEAMIGAFL